MYRILYFPPCGEKLLVGDQIVIDGKKIGASRAILHFKTYSILHFCSEERENRVRAFVFGIRYMSAYWKAQFRASLKFFSGQRKLK